MRMIGITAATVRLVDDVFVGGAYESSTDSL